MPIKRLSVQLANQIAAGEVVERPSSVVKELMENAVDAHATSITLEIKNAGKQLIKVTDNGSGIPEQELVLALAPHATSKISCLEDLAAITTLGFRGEALASIASVSRLTLVSNTKEQPHAYQVEVSGPEQNPAVTPAAHPVGTSVIVRELFFNTPARRRFLKSDKTEFNHIKDLVIRLALVNYHIEFCFIADGKIVLQVPAHTKAQLSQRISRLLGSEFRHDVLRFDNTDPDFIADWCNFLKQSGQSHSATCLFDSDDQSVSAADAADAMPADAVSAADSVSAAGDPLCSRVLAVRGVLLRPPSVSRTMPDRLLTFLNGRCVVDRTLNHAIREGYLDALQGSPDFRPCVRGVLFMECDPHIVDVNVHPRKDEVRFHNANLIHDALKTTVRAVLSLNGLDQRTALLGSLGLDTSDLSEGLAQNQSPTLSAPTAAAAAARLSSPGAAPQRNAAGMESDSYRIASELKVAVSDPTVQSDLSEAVAGYLDKSKIEIITPAVTKEQQKYPGALCDFTKIKTGAEQESALKSAHAAAAQVLKQYRQLTALEAEEAEDVLGTGRASENTSTERGDIAALDDDPKEPVPAATRAPARRTSLESLLRAQEQERFLARKEQLNTGAKAPIPAALPQSFAEAAAAAADSAAAAPGAAAAWQEPVSWLKSALDHSSTGDGSGSRIMTALDPAARMYGANLPERGRWYDGVVAARQGGLAGAATGQASTGPGAQFLSLVAPDVVLFTWEQRYFMARCSDIYYSSQSIDYQNQVQQDQVATTELSIPFALKTDEAGAVLLKAYKKPEILSAAARCGFVVKSRLNRGLLELIRIPQLIEGTNLAAVGLDALHMISAAADSVNGEGRCPKQLCQLLSHARHFTVNTEYDARKLLDCLPLDDMFARLERDGALRELNLAALAAEMLKRP